MNGYYRVGELAKLFHISTDTLRYYEEIGVLVPKRGENNYRLYRAEDVWKLNVIRDLRDLDFSIETIRRCLQDHSIASMLQFIDQEIEAIEEKQKRMERIRQSLLERKAAICEAMAEPVEQIKLQLLPPRPCHRILQSYRTDAEMSVLMKQLVNFDKENLYLVGNTQIGSFIGEENISAGKYNGYDSVFVVHQRGEYTIPGGMYLTLCYHGACTQNSIYIPRMLAHAAKHQLVCLGPVIELVWVDTYSYKYIDEQIIQLQIRVCEARENASEKR